MLSSSVTQSGWPTGNSPVLCSGQNQILRPTLTDLLFPSSQMANTHPATILVKSQIPLLPLSSHGPYLHEWFFRQPLSHILNLPFSPAHAKLPWQEYTQHAEGIRTMGWNAKRPTAPPWPAKGPSLTALRRTDTYGLTLSITS